MTRPSEFVLEATPTRQTTSVGGTVVGPGPGGAGGSNFPEVPVANGDGTATWTSLIALGLFLRTRSGEVGDIEDHEQLGASAVFELGNANLHIGILDTDDTDIVVTGWTPEKYCETMLALTQDIVGGHTPIPAGVTWINGEPDWDLTPGTTMFVVLFSWDGGTVIWGAVVGAGVTTGRWELAVIPGSPPDPLYADGDFLYILVP